MNAKIVVATLMFLVIVAGAGSAFAQPPAPPALAPYFQDLKTVAEEFDNLEIGGSYLNPASDSRSPFKITFPASMLQKKDLQALVQDVRNATGQDAQIVTVRFYATSDGKSLHRMVVQYICMETKERLFVRLYLHGPQAKEAHAEKWADKHRLRLEDRIDVFHDVGTGSGHPPASQTAPNPSADFSHSTP